MVADPDPGNRRGEEPGFPQDCQEINAIHKVMDLPVIYGVPGPGTEQTSGTDLERVRWAFPSWSGTRTCSVWTEQESPAQCVTDRQSPEC